MFRHGSSASSGRESRQSRRGIRPSGLRRSISFTPTATVTVSTDKPPRSNKTTTISPVQSSADGGTPTTAVSADPGQDDGEEVKNLDLSASGFDCIPISLFLEADIFLRIESLDLSQNPLCSSQDPYMTETVLLPNLTWLFLRRCGISQIEPIVRHLRAPSLRELDISNHALTGFVPEFQKYYPKLRHLIASQGQFESVEESAMRGLSLLDLTDNLISDQDGKLKDMATRLGVEVLISDSLGSSESIRAVAEDLDPG